MPQNCSVRFPRTKCHRIAFPVLQEQNCHQTVISILQGQSVTKRLCLYQKDRVSPNCPLYKDKVSPDRSHRTPRTKCHQAVLIVLQRQKCRQPVLAVLKGQSGLTVLQGQKSITKPFSLYWKDKVSPSRSHRTPRTSCHQTVCWVFKKERKKEEEKKRYPTV